MAETCTGNSELRGREVIRCNLFLKAINWGLKQTFYPVCRTWRWKSWSRSRISSMIYSTKLWLSLSSLLPNSSQQLMEKRTKNPHPGEEEEGTTFTSTYIIPYWCGRHVYALINSSKMFVFVCLCFSVAFVLDLREWMTAKFLWPGNHCWSKYQRLSISNLQNVNMWWPVWISMIIDKSANYFPGQLFVL